MTRKTLQRLLLAVAAVLSLGSMAEAAGQKKIVHHRPRHSTRVASGVRTPRKNVSAAKPRTPVRKPLPPKRKPTTKPR